MRFSPGYKQPQRSSTVELSLRVLYKLLQVGQRTHSDPSPDLSMNERYSAFHVDGQDFHWRPCDGNTKRPDVSILDAF